MPIDPTIISQGMANMPDVNALLQQQISGMENINALERQRRGDELVMQDRAAAAAKEQENEAVKALLPAYAHAFKTGDLRGALSLAPEEYQDSLVPYIDALEGKSPEEIQAALTGSLVTSEVGRAFLENMNRVQNFGVQQGQLKVSQDRLAFDIEKAAAEAASGDEVAFRETDPEGNVRMYNKQGKEIGMLPKAGKPASAGAAGAASESERLAAYNSGRVLQAADDINSALQTDPAALSPGNVEAAIGNVVDPNIVRSAERQQVVSAQRELIDALLTLATGAAYNREQREGQIEGFIPKWSDKPAQVKSKLTRVLNTLEMAKVKSGRAWTPEMDAAFQQLIKTFGVDQSETTPSTTVAPPAEGTSVSNW